MDKNFEIEKQNALTKKDKSNEQKWDERIKKLCELINKQKNYFTTSSCSGRISLIRGVEKKVPDIFIFKSHDLTDVKEIIEKVNENKSEEIIYFRQEPCAMHVACKGLDDAIELLNIGKMAGWKRSGIFSVNKEKFVCELVSTEWIVAPIFKNGSLVVSEDYLDFLIKEANKKLERTWKKIRMFEKLILENLSS